MAEPTRHYTIKTLAARWSMSPESVRQRILRGELAALRIGKLWRIRAAVVEAYEREAETRAQTTEADTPPGDDTSKSSGQRRVELDPALREVSTWRKLRRFSPKS